MVAIMLGADNGFFYAGQVMHFSSPFTVFLIYHKQSLTFTDQVNVSWGGFSQIRAELLLLKYATKKEHDYYHLLSGVDMPLKTQDEIHSFFDEKQGKEFIGFDEQDNIDSRIRYYRFIQDKIGRNIDPVSSLLRKVESISLKFQKLLRVDRRKKYCLKMYKGPQWFSITHNMAKYVLSRKNDIVQAYKYGLGVDELFLQSIAMESPYADNIVNDTLRYIDWKRGSPYTFTSEDFELLIKSGKLFARKFDENRDFEIVERIYECLKPGKSLFGQ